MAPSVRKNPVTHALIVEQIDSTGAARSLTNPAPVHSQVFFREDGTRAFPSWVIAAPVTAPAALAALITKAASAGNKHRLYGVIVGKEDAVGNFIQVRDGAAILTGFSAHAAPPFVSPVPIAIGTVNTAMSLNVLNAGAAGIDYAAAMLIETAP